MIIFFFYYDENTDTTVPVPVGQLGITDEQELEFIEDNTIRKVWNPNEEEWYFSIVDVCQYLTDSDYQHARNYWKVLKKRLVEEGFQSVTNCNQLKMPSKNDGKMYKTDCANTEQLLRLIQSIPSKKAEPLKQWLARVGSERLDEMADPEKAMERAIADYRRKGYSEEWISQRLRGIDIRKEMTAEWKRSGIEDDKDYALLTNILTQSWSGKSVKQYKQLKGLKKEGLRDNMTNTELVLNSLAEISATELSKVSNPHGLSEVKKVTYDGGQVAANARKDLESRLGRSIVSPLNSSTPKLLDDGTK
jgi:hypothetical protein